MVLIASSIVWLVVFRMLDVGIADVLSIPGTEGCSGLNKIWPSVQRNSRQKEATDKYNIKSRQLEQDVIRNLTSANSHYIKNLQAKGKEKDKDDVDAFNKRSI